MIEVKRTVSKVIVTEEGLYHVGQVPDSYSGAELEVEVCHQIMFAEEDGRIFVLTLKAPKAKNSNNVEIEYPMSGVTDIEAPTQESTGGSAWLHRLPQAVKNKVQATEDLMQGIPNVVPYL